MAKCEITVEELFKIDNEARRIERERVLAIVQKYADKYPGISEGRGNFRSFDWTDIIDEIKTY